MRIVQSLLPVLIVVKNTMALGLMVLVELGAHGWGNPGIGIAICTSHHPGQFTVIRERLAAGEGRAVHAPAPSAGTGGVQVVVPRLGAAAGLSAVVFFHRDLAVGARDGRILDQGQHWGQAWPYAVVAVPGRTGLFVHGDAAGVHREKGGVHIDGAPAERVDGDLGARVAEAAVPGILVVRHAGPGGGPLLLLLDLVLAAPFLPLLAQSPECAGGLLGLLVDVVLHRPRRYWWKIFLLAREARRFLVEEGGGAAGVAGAALRLEVGGGGAGVGEGLAAAELRRFGGGARAEAGEPLAEAGGAEAGDGDARVEAADGLIHPH